MRKLSIITAAFLLMFVGFQNANAQIDFGLKAGLNLTTWSQDDSFEVNNVDDAGNEVSGTYNELLDASMKPGFHAGAYAKFDMGAFTITPELLYSQKGSKDYYSAPTGESITMNWDYLSLPVMFGVELFDLVGLQAGPQLGFLMVHNQKSDAEAYDVEANIDDVTFSVADGTITRTYSKFDFGLALGVTFDIASRVNAGVRYTHGLGKVINEDYQRQTADNKDNVTQNRTVQAFIGIPLTATNR